MNERNKSRQNGGFFFCFSFLFVLAKPCSKNKSYQPAAKLAIRSSQFASRKYGLAKTGEFKVAEAENKAELAHFRQEKA